jgi:hypothetical protein
LVSARRRVQEFVLLAIALFAVVWAIVRAWVQSITMDEAFTYLYFVAKPIGAVWAPSSNNHVLNSLLMWMAIHAFGTSNITVRAPALLGAVFYIFICKFLCESITERFSLRLPFFICLIFNPFIFDFLVAARGYSMANAFLLAAIAIPVWRRTKGLPSLTACCALASIALGLSFTANFSFAFIDAATLLAIVTWAMRRRDGNSIPRVIAWCVLPGLFVALLLCGYPLAHWPANELWYGAHSFREMAHSLVESSFDQVNRRFGGSLYKVMHFLRPSMLPAIGILCVCQPIATRLDGSWGDARFRWLARFAAALAAVAMLSVLMSWLAFRFDQLPLPLGRTGIYLVPLCTLMVGIVAAFPVRSGVSRWIRRGLTVVLIYVAGYFLFCLRLSYFKEFEVDADIKDVYSVLARLNHTYGVNDVGVTAYYVSSLNYYRVLSKRETFPEFKLEAPEIPVGRSIYVISGVYGREFIDAEKLAIVYRGKSTDVVIAVKPDGPVPAAMIDP